MWSVFWKLAGAFVGVAGFFVLLAPPKKYWLYAAFVGTCGWAVYIFVEAADNGLLLKNFLAACTVAVLSQILARRFKAPVTMFVIPGILPLVPGAGMYQVAYNTVLGNRVQTTQYLIQTLQVAGTIALGIFLADTLQKVLFPKHVKKI